MFEVTQQKLDIFKRLNPSDDAIQALTVTELQAKAAEKNFDWKTITWEQLRPNSNSDTAVAEPAPVQLTDCQMAIGYVVFDCVCLALGAIGLRSTVNGTTIAAIFNAAAPSMSAIEQSIAQIGRQGASLTDKAKAVFSILKAIWNGGSLSAVFSAFVSGLTWWDAALYGVTGLATIVAALATDGLAFVAQIVILLASFGFLASDSVRAISACNISTNSASVEAATNPVSPVPASKSAFIALQDNVFPGWTQVPNSGNVSFVTVLPDGTIAGIGLDSTIYIFSMATNNWLPVSNSGPSLSLSAFGGLFMVVNTDNQLYITESLGSTWDVVPNSGSVICAAFVPDGTIIGIGTDQFLYTKAGLNDVWIQIPNSSAVTSLAVMPDGTLLGIGIDGSLNVRGDDVDTPWVAIPNSGTVMSVAAFSEEGLLLGVGRDNFLYETPMA